MRETHHPFLEPFFYTQTDAFCQDRLGTSMGKRSGKFDAFCYIVQVAARMQHDVTLQVKNGLLKPFIYKMMILPRQARDKHRENSKKEAVLSQHDVTLQVLGGRTCSGQYILLCSICVWSPFS
eukprot:COSAG06_NODE_1842_length_8236_cov_57.085904_5_plen_123_part_00